MCKIVKGFFVLGVDKDIFFLIYFKIGVLILLDRVVMVSWKIKILYEDEFLEIEVIIVVEVEDNYDIVYNEIIIMSVFENDVIWYYKMSEELVLDFKKIIEEFIIKS